MSGQLTALIAAILWLQATAVPTGDHTCTGVVKHPVNVLVNVTEPVTFRTYTWCLRVPPRCSKYTVQLKDRVKLHVEMHNKTITVCCEGFVEMEGRCVPACPPGADCPFMRCNRTNHCHCTPGYTGLYCNEACPRGLWGKDCKRPCDCPSGYTCHHLTGDCFVDDRPPRRTTTPTTTTTTTTTTTPRPTTVITTPTTEGTTLETVKTPVFRFPPPPWVESAADNKKTTTRQVKKEESPPTKEMDVSQEISEMTTKKTPLDISLPTLATVQMVNKTSVERPPTIELFPPIWNEDEINKKPTDDSTNFKKLETIDKFPIIPPLSTISLKSTEKEESQIKDENSIKKEITLLKTITTPIPSSPTTEFPNNFDQHTITIETPIPNNVASNHQINAEILPISTVVQTSTPSVRTVTTKLPEIVTQKPTRVTESPTTQHILYDTKPIESTFHEEILATSTNDHAIESTTQTTTHKDISILEPKSTVNTRVFIPSNEFQITTKPKTKADENIKLIQPILDNKHQPTTTVFINPTKSIHLEEKHLTSIPSDLETSPEFIVFKTENIPVTSTSNNKIPFIHSHGFSPASSTASDVSIYPSTRTPHIENTNTNPDSTTSTTYHHVVLKQSENPFPPSVSLTTVATTTPNLLTTPITWTTTTPNPTTMKSSITSTTTILPTIPTLNTRTPLVFSISPSTIAETAVPVINVTPSSAPTTSGTPATFAFTPITESNTVTPIKTSTSATKYMAPILSVSEETPKEENNYETAKPQVEETVTTPTLAGDITKDFNAHKKIKPDEAQDKPKKKHEKAKPKNVNAKEFPSIYQTKTEKQNETMMQQTTKLTLRSILQAKTFINKIITSTSPMPKINQPPTDFMDMNFFTDERPAIESVSIAPTPSKTNQIWYALKKQNFSNSGLKVQEPLGNLKEPSEISESSLITTEMNRVMESNTIDYRQSSEEPMKKALAQEEENNYSLIFNKIKFNMTESVAAGVRSPRQQTSHFHLPMILVLGIALVTLLLLTLTLWVYLKRRRQRAEPFPPCIMAYAMEETPPMDCDNYDQAFFCPTFTNTYAEKINRELRELNYDHPRSSQPEPLYAEIFN